MTLRADLVTVRTMLRVGAPPRGHLAVTTALGAGAAAASVALMACSGLLIDRAALRPPLYTLTVLMAAVQLLALARGPLRYVERLVSHDAAFGVLARLRLWLFDQLEPRAPAGLRRSRSGDLLARATEDVDTLQDLYLRGVSPLLVAVAVSALAVGIVGALLPLAGVVLAASLVAGLVGPPAVALAGGRAAHREAELRGRLSAEVVDLLQGAPDLLAYGLEDEYLNEVLETDRALTALARRRSFAAGAVSALTIVCTGAAVVGMMVVAAAAVRSRTLEPVMIGVLPLVALAAFEIVPPVTDAVMRLTDHVEAAKRLLALSELPVPVSDPASLEPLPSLRPPPEIVLRDVRLRYGPDLPWALDGVTLRVPPGHRVAIMGPSGSGKSSLVNVLLRFWPISRGEVTVGGIPLTSLAQDDARRLVGLLSQEAHLFDTSIGNNITLARPDATAQEVAEVLRLAQLESWVASLPAGLSTPVGERGTQVSGGQRQRIALARTLLADPPVLVLDEPTAGLDDLTADRLLTDVLEAAVGRSLILVTHRPSEATGFDTVVVLDRGRMVGQRTGGAPARASGGLEVSMQPG